MSSSRANLGTALALAAYFSLTVSDTFSKLLAGALDPFEVAFSGGLFGLLLIPFVCHRPRQWVDIVRPNYPRVWFTRAICVFVATAASVKSFMLLPLPEALSLMFLAPLFITIISVIFLKEHVTFWAWLAVFLGFGGILIVLRPGIKPFSEGDFWALIAAVACAVSITSCRFATKEKPLALFGSTLVGPFVGNGILMGFSATWPQNTTIAFYLFGYGFLAALGQLFMMMATDRAPANRVALPQYSQMIWGVIISYIVFHQGIDMWTYIGITALMLSGILNWIRQTIRYQKMALRDLKERYKASRAHRRMRVVARKMRRKT